MVRYLVGDPTGLMAKWDALGSDGFAKSAENALRCEELTAAAKLWWQRNYALVDSAEWTE